MLSGAAAPVERSVATRAITAIENFIVDLLESVKKVVVVNDSE